MDICADEYERARAVPVMIPLGRGLWNTIRRDHGYTPAAYTVPTLGMHLALALWPESADGGRDASPGVTQEVAYQARRATQAEPIPETGEEDTIQIHSQYDHGSGNVIVALGPGGMIIAAVSIGGTINIRDAGEAMHLPLTQHACAVIRHPTQANLQAARHNIGAFVQVEIESVTGTVWHHQRRRRAATMHRDTTATTEFAEQNASRVDGSYDQRRPSDEANPGTPCTASTSTLGGSLPHMCHAQWESILNAPVIDYNPLVASVAREAAGEVLSSFGAGASADMIHALATWIVSHVRNRHATCAPNHWCWSIPTVCWLNSRAMQHNGNEKGLSVRSLASHFGMNAAGMRQRPIATWEQGGTTRAYAFDPGTLPPGAQSLGEQESVVSHTNPRVSRAANTLLDRLVQAIWTEPLQEDPRDQGSGDEPHTDDADMQVDNEGGSEITATTTDRAPEEDPANTPATTGVALWHLRSIFLEVGFSPLFFRGEKIRSWR